MIMSDYESFVGLCYHALLLGYLKKNHQYLRFVLNILEEE